VNCDEWGLPLVENEFVVECDEELGEAIDAVILANARAGERQAEICELFDVLREAVYADTWRLVEEIRSRARQREEDLGLVIAKWAFREGRGFPWPTTPAEPEEDAVTSTKKPKLVDAPLAVTSAGDVVLNITHVEDGAEVDPVAAVRRLLDVGHEVFVGVVIPKALRPELLRDVHDVLADAVGRAAPKIRRGRDR
jgi:hypothetical protein